MSCDRTSSQPSVSTYRGRRHPGYDPTVLDTTSRAGRRLVRSALLRLARHERTAPWVERLRVEAERALDDSRYTAEYYRTDLSDDGYGEYNRTTSNADKLATLVWTWFDVRSSLDVGCAAGFVVEALDELGISASGVDLSSAAFDLAAPHIRPGLAAVDLRDGLPHRDGEVELVTAFETLEHLRPPDVPDAVAELARVSSAWVVVSIPSVGANYSGTPGWFDGKVRADRLDHYRSVGDALSGPVPFDDLALDDAGRPVKGHLTIAPFLWWSERFEDVGLIRHYDLERRINIDLARYGLTEFVCLYVFGHPGITGPSVPVRTDRDIADAEKRFGLTDHEEPSHHYLVAYHVLRAAGLELRPGLVPPPEPSTD